LSSRRTSRTTLAARLDGFCGELQQQFNISLQCNHTFA
jgi:hypothetical protein